MAELTLEDFDFSNLEKKEIISLFKTIARQTVVEVLEEDYNFLKDKNNKEKISKSKKADITRVQDYWNEVSTVKNTRLYYNSKVNIINAVSEYGIDRVFEAIDIIWRSPLMKCNNPYKKYLQSLDWFSKPESISKIFSGHYDPKKQGFHNDDFNENDESYD